MLQDVSLRTLILVSPVPLSFYQRSSLTILFELLVDAAFDTIIVTPSHSTSKGTVSCQYNEAEGCQIYRTFQLLTVATAMKPFNYEDFFLATASRCYFVSLASSCSSPLATLALSSNAVDLPESIKVPSLEIGRDVMNIWSLSVELVMGGNKPETEATLLDEAVLKVVEDMAGVLSDAFSQLGKNAFGSLSDSNGVDVLISMLHYVFQQASEKYRDLFPLVPSRWRL